MLNDQQLLQHIDHQMELGGLTSSLAWLKDVNGASDDYLAQWDISEWVQWYRAMACLRMTPNPCVPVWLSDIIGDDWSKNWSLPWPSIGQLWPTAHNWFAEHHRRDDFQLTVVSAAPDSSKSTPYLQELQRAWHLAAEHPAVVPLLMLELLPSKPQGACITGEITGFIVVAAQYNRSLNQELAHIFKHPGETNNLFFQEDLQAVTGLEANPELVVVYELDWLEQKCGTQQAWTSGT